MKKFSPYILILIITVGLLVPVYKLHALVDPDGTCTINGVVQPGKWKESNCRASSGSWVGPYVLLEPLPCTGGPETGCINGQLKTFDPTGSGGGALGGYLNLIIKLFIGICAVLAVIVIVMGGIEYMTTELVSSKEAGKERIRNAIFGLLLALGAWTLLNQINPDILKTDLTSLQSVTVEVDLNADVPQTPVNGKYANGTTFGNPWDSGNLTSLPSGVTTNHPGQDCATIGQPNCTSVRKLNLNYINKIQTYCSDCTTLVITGGTESWLHGGASGNTSHGLDSPTVDLRADTALTNYIKSGTPTTPNRWTKDGISYLWEIHGGVTHWHVGP